MSERTPAAADATREGASRLVRQIQRNVLPNDGRRAAVKAAVRRAPGDPRTFHAIKEIADFLPENFDPATERAYMAVAAMMCDQPPRGRNADIVAVQPRTDDSAKHGGEPDGADVASEQARTSRPRVGSFGESCAKAVNLKLRSESAMEARLHAICRGNATTVHYLLPELVKLLRREGVDVNWMRLIDDLAAWDRRRQATAARWLREFYRNLKQDEKNQDDEQENA